MKNGTLFTLIVLLLVAINLPYTFAQYAAYTQTDEELELFTGHTDWVESVASSSDGSTLASGSEDGTILLWDLTPKPPRAKC